ncbi:hypothetical protein F2Q69_00057181 [Brassica cretica]|uniref:Disease resistance protein Roq1-like winged-helix domain-containing protein n=1 Tax=Brassica cretica TaxID=69181 RepID=A0A8S9MP38_BRACR|nr:hypothetical protein F2Q69_00057181 [Brassica cretica]
MIEDISTDVFNKLNNSAQSSDFGNLVGMSTHMIKLKLLLRLGSNEVRMIGFWGPSGIDDVDHSMQIDAIAKEARWFGPGSRIIITTQDKGLLNPRRIDDIYEVEFPPDDEALEIFCMYAFGQKSPHDGFKELAWEVTKLAGNLPLGLKVIGSYFEGRPKQEWEEDLPRLRSILDGEIESILKFSYDALCVDDQDLFLHLACFFNDETLEIVEGCLEKNFVGVKGRLRGLAEKSFISFEWGYTEIHDLLARFGTN